tara:strand:- start:130 stop:1125 length:996 start_codon:yes stop_codon:yes gene_type:complete
MIYKQLTRRKFINIAKLSVLFLITSCKGVSKKISIGFYKNFLPVSFINLLPKNWKKENLNFKEDNFNKNLRNKDILLINDGWLGRVELKQFNDISNSLINYLDERSKSYLTNWELLEQKKLYPIGVIPYAVIIKNNKYYKITNKNNWDFLLSRDLMGKMILPNSPRILMSIAERVKNKNAMKSIINQGNIYDDINAIDFLINTDAVLAILPLTICEKYLKFDSRLSIVFPNQGVPLMWNFLLINNNFNQTILHNWIDKLFERNSLNKLIKDGYYLPFSDAYIQSKYKYSSKSARLLNRPSEECWENSWSFNPLKESEKIELEKKWKESLAP